MANIVYDFFLGVQSVSFPELCSDGLLFGDDITVVFQPDIICAIVGERDGWTICYRQMVGIPITDKHGVSWLKIYADRFIAVLSYKVLVYLLKIWVFYCGIAHF